MKGCAAQRVAEAVVVLAVVLLLALLVVLWGGSAGRGPAGPARLPAAADDDARTAAAAAERGGAPGWPLAEPEGEPPENEEPGWGHWRSELFPSDAGNAEYVMLAKSERISYDESADGLGGLERHHSGNFRRSQSKVWDPHPQYDFVAFGHRFDVRLREDGSFAPPGVTVTHVSENFTRRERPNHQLGCFYTGYLEGDPKSVVAVSLCHGMTGHMRTSTGNYLIKPSERWSGDDESLAASVPLQHVIYRLTRNNPKTHAADDGERANDVSGAREELGGVHACGVADGGGDSESVVAQDEASDDSKTLESDSAAPERRRRRHVSVRSYNSYDAAERPRPPQQQQQEEEEEEEEDNEERSFVFDDEPDPESSNYSNWRTRRALPREYFIEIMVVADATMIDYHGAGLTSYILVLMNTVSRIYKDPSIGNPMSIAVIKIKQVNKVFGVKQRNSDGIEAAGMLKKFCDWQNVNNPHEPSPEHHDAALLLTRENLCHKPGQKPCDTLGLAELGRMCSINSSCAIVQDNGLATAFTIAHEIGHVLNMPHDDDQKCTRYRDRSADNIMSRMLDDNTIPWEWSKCSRHYLTEFLDAGFGNCLLDEPGEGKVISRPRGSRLPGEDYSQNKQCELVYGPGSEICPHMAGDACKRLWCTIPQAGAAGWASSGGGVRRRHQEQCHTQHMPWADGTVCGPERWCHRGECVPRLANLEPVDGQWGEWTSYGECSRTCGGGIKKKYRHCDSPAPKNGGNYCVGERVRYRSCATRDCPSGSLDFREEQCAQFDNDNRNIRNLTKSVKWHAKYDGVVAEDRCKLYCQVASNQYYMLREKVVDGTACGPGTFHVCVNGHCKPAGCDHTLNSTASLDTCGVCRGDNSTCRRISGAYNASEYGYTRVTKIPAGSSYIDIRQYGWRGSHNDSNYLALRLRDSGKYILNGNFMVMQQKVIMHPGATIEYSGPEQVVERLNSSRPIRVDLILEVLSVGSVNPPQITYEYTVPKRILAAFTWRLSDWTACDRVCRGASHRRAQCRSAESEDVVSDDYCPAPERPREETRACNTHCELQWQEVPNSRSECSSDCGPGTLHVRYRCVQVAATGVTTKGPASDGERRPQGRPVPSHACFHLERPQELAPCTGACESARWKYGEWGACSVTCGDYGLRHRAASCVDADNKTLPDDSCSRLGKIVSQSCGYKSCPTWTFGDWSACSASCGVGKRERPYWCRIDNRVVNPSHCGGQPARVSEACDAGPCLAWHVGDWSPCAATCGDAVRRRTVICKYSNGSLGKDCDSSAKPINAISCALQPCSAEVSSSTPATSRAPIPPADGANQRRHQQHQQQQQQQQQHENDVDSRREAFDSAYVWSVEGFDECSKACGGGLARQIIKCSSAGSGLAAPSQKYCEPRSRPADVISCNEHRCPDWAAGPWSQCDVKCGDGYQHRQILCQDSRGEVVHDGACSEKSRPRHARRCQKPACVLSQSDDHLLNLTTYKWHAGSWGECSASCGNGVRRREVSCHRVNGFGWQDPSPSSGCAYSDKPASEQLCKIRGCADRFYWMAGSWKKCSQPCGRKGRQVRRLFCLDLQGRKVRRRHCPAGLRPQRKRKCNQRPCTGPTSCLDLQARLKASADGEYTLLVGGRYMSIYCHGMEGREPLEYLTLPSGERENYAEVYDKRLQDPRGCPYAGRRNDSCECLAEALPISGRSVFKRIRIDVRTLHVVADDYRFSTRIGQNDIEYGKAGDCYSQADCPQGRFGINLSGTLLMLAPDVHWPRQKSTFTLINKISNQRVIGKCGGYCGFCTPFPGLKLNVLPP